MGRTFQPCSSLSRLNPPGAAPGGAQPLPTAQPGCAAAPEGLSCHPERPSGMRPHTLPPSSARKGSDSSEGFA